MKPYASPAAMPASTRDRDGGDRRQAGGRHAHGRRRQPAHQELALGADVEQARLEADADREAGQHQRRRLHEGVDDGVERADRTGDQAP